MDVHVIRMVVPTGCLGISSGFTMRSPRLQQIRNIIEHSGGGVIKADYLPGSWVVEVKWGELVECEKGEIEAEGFPRMKYPQEAVGYGKTFTAAVKDAFTQVA